MTDPKSRQLAFPAPAALLLLVLAGLVWGGVLLFGAGVETALGDIRDGQAATAPAAPGKDAGPALSELERLRVVNASMAVENWTLKVQAAVAELQKARAEFDKTVAGVTPAGYRLTEALELVKIDKPKGGG